MHWTQRQARMSQAPERMRRHVLAVWTRGGSRMRESRPYGSVRGACDETHVPTATAACGVMACPDMAGWLNDCLRAAGFEPHLYPSKTSPDFPCRKRICL